MAYFFVTSFAARTTAPHGKSASGFTLVELAIAMIVIGLLIGGILKGQELLGNAGVTNAVRQINEYDTAAMTFKTSYGALPGDMPNPADRLRDCDASTHCPRGGNDNGIIRKWDTTPQGVETFNFFPHLSRAGLVDNFTGGLIATTTESASRAALQPYFPILLKHFLSVLTFPEVASLSADTATYFKLPGMNVAQTTLSGHVMRLIDEKLDDGLPDKGTVFVRPASGGICPTATNAGALYYAKKGTSSRCQLYIKAGF